MNRIFCKVAAATLALCLHQLPAFADGVPGAGTEIAKCSVNDSSDPDFGNALEVFQRNDADASIVVVFGKDGEKSLFPADSYRFSPEKASLQLQFANFIFADIHRGPNARGSLRVKLGGNPSSLACDSSW